MWYAITKKFEFEAAHFLPGHPGKCANLHGHTYRLEVTIGANELDESGMVMDFGLLKAIVEKDVIDKMDHALLNDVLPFSPTAENVAVFIFHVLKKSLRKHHAHVVKVRLYETSNSYAEVGLT